MPNKPTQEEIAHGFSSDRNGWTLPKPEQPEK